MCRESIVIRLTHPYIPLYSNLFYSTLVQSWTHTSHIYNVHLTLTPCMIVSWHITGCILDIYGLDQPLKWRWWDGFSTSEYRAILLLFYKVDDFTLVAFSLASVYLVVLFSTCTCTVFKLQLVLCSSFTKSINHQPINQSKQSTDQSYLFLN